MEITERIKAIKKEKKKNLKPKKNNNRLKTRDNYLIKSFINDNEDNDCEALIRIHKNVRECSLMTEGYHSVKNTYYFCTCDPDCQMPLCLACIKKCHSSHWRKKKLEDMFTDKRAALCCCGLKNHILIDGVAKGDFVYDEQCQYLDWSITAKTFIFYEDIKHPADILCMFCYNLCKNKPENYVRKSDELLCHRLKCCDKHEDYLSIFEKFGEITKNMPFNFEGFTGIQFLNMVLMSSKSFENSFHRLLNTLDCLEIELLKKSKKKFDFITYINNSPFMKAIERIQNILFICKSMFYTTSIIDISRFIFPLLQRKFNYKSQENIWVLKRNLFEIYHKLNFRKDFEPLPLLKVKDLTNLNPYQRFLYCDYISEFEEIEKKYFHVKQDKGYKKNYIDENLRTLEKYKTIKDKGEQAYEILRIVYSEIKKFSIFNKISGDQCMKFFSLNDNIIFNGLEDKEYKLPKGLSQMRMLVQMVECILYLAYYYNDNQLKKYLRGEVDLNQLSFFHGNNETAKMIYKNTTHILLYCRTIHQNYVIDKKHLFEEQMYNKDDKIHTQKNTLSSEKMINKLTKLHNKIMFMSTEIISLTLNNDDLYLYGLKSLVEQNMDKYSTVYKSIYTPKEEELISSLKKMCFEIEETYQKFFLFEIKNEEVERCIIKNIKHFFEIIEIDQLKMNPKNYFSDEKSNNEALSLKIKRKKTNIFSNYLQITRKKDRKNEEKKIIRILINKTPFMFTVVKSLEMILTMNNNSISQDYVDCLFNFLNFYVEDSPDNIMLVISDKVLKSFLILSSEYSIYFINLLDYMIKTLLKKKRLLNQNNVIMKVVANLIERISDKSEYIFQFQKLLKIINKLSKMQYLHQEHTMNKIRKTIKIIYKKNPIFSTFRNLILPKDNQKTLQQMIADKDVIGNYSVETMVVLFTQFLKLVNYLFDGNSTLNENEFLAQFFSKEQIPDILKDLSLYLPLRSQIIRFFRISYMDIIIDPLKIKDYISIFTKDIKSDIDQNSSNFILFQDLLKVNDKNYSNDIDCEMILFELQNFKNILENNEGLAKKKLMQYFEEAVVLPLSVFINTYISMIYNLNGYQYIKFYELILHFFLVKKYIIESIRNMDINFGKNIQKSFWKTASEGFENKYGFIVKILENESLEELDEDINKITQKNKFEIINYKFMYNLYIKHSINFIRAEEPQHLDEIFSKKTIINDDYFDEKKNEYNTNDVPNNLFKQKILNVIAKYEKDKCNFPESALSQNLSEKNVIYDATYRKIMLKPIFFLINSETLYAKYRRQNLWNIFRLLQWDTKNTQRDILEIRNEDIERMKKINTAIKKLEDEEKNNLIKSPEKNNEEEKGSEKIYSIKKSKFSGNDNEIKMFEESNYNDNKKSLFFSNKKLPESNKIDDTTTVSPSKITIINIEEKPIIDIQYLISLFIENLLSIFFSSCNPSAISANEDYMIAYMIIKTMKYMCEDHNLQFQTVFFQEIKVEYENDFVNVFDLMMCTLDKVLIFAKWDEVNYDSDENKIVYFYDIFFCMIEFAIEMIQGTSEENLLSIIDQKGRKNEKSFFYRFLIKGHYLLRNNNNDSEVLYNVRINIVSFLQAFIEEKSTPRKIILLLENLFSPISIFDIIIITLKKLYMKTVDGDIKKSNEIEFDQEKCKLFISKYFTDSEFSKHQEFELCNNMYLYVKALANFKNKDAVNFIESVKKFTEQKIISLRENRNNDKMDTGDDSESILVDPRHFQIYFVVKFFETITRGVWIQGENDKNPQFVLFTLDPTVLYLSQNSKNNFIKDVPRDTRSSKLFSLMEYANYFFIEINQNKKKLSSSCFWRFLNKVNYDYVDYLIFAITSAINVIIFIMAESKDAANNFRDIHTIILPITIIQIFITFFFFVSWVASKFSLFYTIEKEKYYIRHRINKIEKLNIPQYLDIIILKTLLSHREIVNFIWYFIFGLIGLSSGKLIFAYSIQILIVVNINTTLQNIIRAIVMRYKQLLTFLMFLIVITYIFSTVAFYLLSKDFIHVNEGNQENACGSLFFCFLTHLEFGLRTDGGIGEYTSKLSFLDTPLYFMGMFFYQFIFYIMMIVIMLAVIGGSVIDTFAELRYKTREDINDLKNICFICNGNRNEIEKSGEKFEEHIENVHNIWNYVDYMIGLKKVDPQETNAINSFVIEQLQDKKISWFPSFIEKDDYIVENEN